MTFKHEFKDGILFFQFPERVTENDMKKLDDELSSIEQQYPIIPHRIADLRPIKAAEFKFDTMLLFTRKRTAKEFGNSIRSALLVKDNLQLGFARMFQTLNDNKRIEIEIFFDERKAIEWIKSSTTG